MIRILLRILLWILIRILHRFIRLFPVKVNQLVSQGLSFSKGFMMVTLLRLLQPYSRLIKLCHKSFQSPHGLVRLQSLPKHSFSTFTVKYQITDGSFFSLLKAIRLPLLFVPLGLFTRGFYGNAAAQCRSKGSSGVSLLRTRHILNGGSSNSASFDWSMFWSILAPDILILLLAAMVIINCFILMYVINFKWAWVIKN